MLRPYDRVTFRGHRFNRRTKRMILAAEKLAGFQFHIAQGSFNRGGVAASAGTHDGSSLDVGMAGVPTARRVAAVHALKSVGFAAYYRSPAQGFSPHIHAIPIGDREVSSSAAAQVRDYDHRRNGLANHGPDNTWRPAHPVRWAFWRNRAVPR